MFPASGYFFLVWKTFAKLKKMCYEDMHIIFENVKLLRATILVNDLTEFIVSIAPNSGHFEVGDILPAAIFHVYIRRSNISIYFT